MFGLKARKAISSSYRFGLAALFFGLLILVAVCSNVWAAGGAKGSVQDTFASPEEAAKVLASAAKENNESKLATVLGPGSGPLLSSGDEVEDREQLEKFVRKYEEKNTVLRESDNKAILEVGNDAWPLPIPMVKVGERWRFDIKQGAEEIIDRRIGKNELSAIQVCLAYVDAQREYATKDRDSDGLLEYAQKFLSEPGKKDGLYWEAKEGEAPSPLGPLAARAKEEGYTRKSSSEKPSPYHGYYYKILKAQGKSAPSGAYSYLVKGRMIGGFALVAYPAVYGVSGIMTFIVNHEGVVYQKDLGKNTEAAAMAMTSYDPDQTWHKVEDKDLELAGTGSKT